MASNASTGAPPAGAAVDDQIVGPLGHLGIEVVHQHAQRRLRGPPIDT